MSTWQTTNEAANQSTVYAKIIVSSDRYSAYDGYATSYNINIGGNNYGAAGPSRIWYSESWETTASRTYTHTSAGARGAVDSSVSFTGSGWAPSGSAGPQQVGGLDYYRPPSAPASMTVSNIGSTITGSWPDASTPFGPLTYYWASRSSSNGGSTWSAWSGDNNVGTGKTFTQTFTAGLTYQFRVRAANSDGTSGWRESSTLFLTAGGKRYTGTNWALTTAAAKRYTGTAWANITTSKKYDATSKTWVNLS